jgi:hypothetical protein
MKQTRKEDNQESYYLELAKQKMRAQMAAGADQLIIQTNVSPDHKITEALFDVIDPWLDEENSLEDVQTLVSIGALAWNASFNEGATARDKARPFLKTFNADVRTKLTVRQMMLSMIERKLKLHPDDRRKIVDYEVRDTGDGLHVSVFSVPADQPETEATEAGDISHQTSDQTSPDDQ